MRLNEPESEQPIKCLILGNSGSGKTGALASLAEAGYSLHIADFDRGTPIIRNILRGNVAALSRVEVEYFTDSYKNVGPRVIPDKVHAWADALGTLTTWTKNYQSLEHIIVIDSLNFATKAAFNWILTLAGRLTVPKEIQDWLAAQDLIEAFLMKLYSQETRCHVIMTSHIQYLGASETDIKVGYPMTAVGRSFAPKIPRFFNSCILCRSTGTGTASKREIHTAPIDFVELKSESLDVKKTYPLQGGLAQFFKDVRKTDPLTKAAATTVTPLVVTR